MKNQAIANSQCMKVAYCTYSSNAVSRLQKGYKVFGQNVTTLGSLHGINEHKIRLFNTPPAKFCLCT